MVRSIQQSGFEKGARATANTEGYVAATGLALVTLVAAYLVPRYFSESHRLPVSPSFRFRPGYPSWMSPSPRMVDPSRISAPRQVLFPAI